MKVLVAGLGSAGQRHVRNLQAICGVEIEILAWRTRGWDLVLNNELKAQFGRNPEQVYGLQKVDTLEEGLEAEPQVVVIANPISLHLSTALASLKSNCHVFIEKPLAGQFEGVKELIALAEQNDLIGYVGYQMRFHPGLRRLQEWLQDGAIGKPVSANFHFGEYLPGMHPYEDYRVGHAARKDQHGGVILALSHELDTVQWLFGMPLRVYGVGGHLSSLEIDVEDTAVLTLECLWKGKILPVSVYLDFVQQPPRRYCEIVGEEGTIRWDYIEKSVALFQREQGQWQVESFFNFDRNQLFLDEMRIFCVQLRKRKNH